MRAVLPRIPTSYVRPQCRLGSPRRVHIPSQSTVVVGGNRGKPSAAGYAYFPRRAEATKSVIADRHVSIESWEDELVNSSSVGVRRPEGARIATRSQPNLSSINVFQRRRANKRLQNIITAEAQVIVVQPVLEVDVLPPLPTDEPGTDERGGTTQWQTVVALSALVVVICSVDRAAMSVALGPMGEQFQWSDTVKGQVSSSFFLGYTLTNFVGGYMATRWSPKLVLSVGVVFWSICTMATPFAASTCSLPALLATRAAMGIGEGVTFPAVSNLFARWVPKASLSQALSVAYSGGPVGIILALLAAPTIITHLGWPAVFFLFGGAGLTWVLTWVPLVDDHVPVAVIDSGRPKDSTAPTGDVTAAASKEVDMADVPWGAFVRSPALWSLLAVHCSHGVAPLICLSWMPSYYAAEFNLDVGSSAALSLMPWAANVVCTNLAGWLGDRAVGEAGYDRTVTRKVMQGIASLGPAACLLALAADQGEHHSQVVSVALLSATLALGGFQAAGLGSNHQDLAPRYSGILYGITNAASSVAGCGGILATGLLLDSGTSWSTIFSVVAGIYCVGFAGFAIWGSAEQQFD